MELIDRKPFIKYANEQITGTFAYPQGHKAEDEKAYREKWEFVRNVLMSAPIIEAEPIKHGQWLSIKVMDDEADFGETDGAECSVCGYTTNSEYWAKTYYHHCPNCGAKMQEVGNG